MPNETQAKTADTEQPAGHHALGGAHVPLLHRAVRGRRQHEVAVQSSAAVLAGSHVRCVSSADTLLCDAAGKALART